MRYIESSALVAALLERDSNARESIRTRGRKVTSALTIAETARAIFRARATARLTADEERLSEPVGGQRTRRPAASVSPDIEATPSRARRYAATSGRDRYPMKTAAGTTNMFSAVDENSPQTMTSASGA